MQLNNATGSFDIVWAPNTKNVSVENIMALTGATELEIEELIEYEVLVPINAAARPYHFAADCIVIVNQARRLRDDMHLGAHELAITLTLLERIRYLEAALTHAIAQRSVFRCY